MRGFTLATVSGTDQVTTIDWLFPEPLVVAVASPFGEPVAGGQVTFIAPDSGASADFAPHFASIGLNGQAQALTAANGIAGTYTVIARSSGAGMVTFPLTNQNPAPIPPTVTGLRRFGVHARPTSLVLSFSKPLDAARAQNLANYRLAWLPPNHRFANRSVRPIPLRSVRYDAPSQSVTLSPARRLSLWPTYQLTVNGTPSEGLTDASGVYLDGAGTGQPGSDYVTTFNRDALVLPPRPWAHWNAHRTAPQWRGGGA